MKMFLSVCRGEIKKQQRNYFNSWSTYISLLVWPVLTLAVSYYSYLSFDLEVLTKIGIHSADDLAVFLLTGALCYNCFWLMVQSAFFMLNERENGTLEMVFMTPASRMGILYGRSLGVFNQGIWFFVFYMVMVMVIRGTDAGTVTGLPAVFVSLLVSAVIWGGFMNAVFITSRDASFWFILCDEPMKLLSGVQLPVTVMPFILRALSVIFPLTYCLDIARSFFSGAVPEDTVWLKYIMINLLLIMLTGLILRLAEKHNRTTGNLQFY